MCLLFFSVREAFAIVKMELIDTRRSFSLCEHHSLLLSHFSRGEKLTGLVSRVLYDLSQQSSIFTANLFAVQALRLCHHAHIGGPPKSKDSRKVLLRIGFTARLCYHKRG